MGNDERVNCRRVRKMCVEKLESPGIAWEGRCSSKSCSGSLDGKSCHVLKWRRVAEGGGSLEIWNEVRLERQPRAKQTSGWASPKLLVDSQRMGPVIFVSLNGYCHTSSTMN